MSAGRRLFLAGAAVFALSLAPTGSATAQEIEVPPVPEVDDEDEPRQRGGGGPKPARITLRVRGDSHGTVHVGDRVRVIGRIRPYAPSQRVLIRLARNGTGTQSRRPIIDRLGNRDVGKFSMRSERLIKPGDYRVRAIKPDTRRQKGDRAKAPKFHITYPDLDPGQHNSDVAIFNGLLKKARYYTNRGKSYGGPTERAVMAYRKANRMARSYNATPGIFRTLADGRGRVNLKHPGAGRHVEVDISKQIMILARGGRPQHIFHVSTGAPATPTVRGKFRFYRREPGYNSVHMYYSVYFHRGYAIHGYRSVPPYPASHGCVRNPIPNSRFIYDWVRLGMAIYTYG